VNERATEVTDESEQPEDQKHNKDSPEHMFSFELVYFASCADAQVRLKIFWICKLFSRGATLWRFEESTGGSDLERLQRCVGSIRQPMRFKLVFTSLLALSFSGGAFGAIVVEKQSRQLPFVEVVDGQGIHSFVFRGPKGTSRKPILVPPEEYWTVREAGLYKFVVRYHSGNVCSRLVTPEVFARYRVGDDFRDNEPFTERVTEDSKTVQPVVHHRKHTAQTRKHGRVSHRVAKHRRGHRALRIASR
jgi:hypothetical protein